MEKTSVNVNELVAIYTDTESNHFGFGKVLVVSDEELVISSIQPNGEESGLTMYNLDEICKIEKKTKYICKMEKILNLKKTKLFTPKLANENLKKEIFTLAKKNKKIVSIQLWSSHQCDVIGFVEKLSEKICEIKQIDDGGYEDGYCTISLDDISSIHYDNYDNRDLELLYSFNSNR